MTTSGPDANPYVGPRSFDRSDRLYGRERETQDLVDLLIAERVVLLHSPSGAGKTSLIRAGLTPRLEEDGFTVLPIVRLTHELPPDLAATPTSGVESAGNGYVRNTLLSLEEGLAADQQRPLAELAGLSIARYLAERPRPEPRPEVLVFDQFEEIVTADPTDLAAKREFFTQLGAALADRSRWALFALREDFLAELDPYTRLVPTRFTQRYRLDLLSVAAATEAVLRPARDAGVEFASDAAGKLIDDLRRVRVQRPTGPVDAHGPNVEPVQLQVVCRRLWERLPAGTRTVDLADVREVGDVDHSLAGFYAECVAAAARWAGMRERLVRDWFERELVTAQGFRGQAVDGPLRADPQDRRLLDALTGVHLLRAESRRGATWYELAHDRLVAPVLADNARWRAENLSDLERRAAWWDEQGRPDRLLLTGAELASTAPPAEAEAAERERDFLAASQRAVAQAERERRANTWIRCLLVVATLGCVLAGTFLVTSVRSWNEADRQRLTAAKALLLNEGGQQLTGSADLGLLLGLRAVTLGDDRAAEDPDVQAFLQTALDTVPVVQVLRDGGPATDVGYTADGRFLITAGHADKVVRVLDAGTGAVARSLPAAGEVRAVAVGPGSGPDRVAIAAAEADGAVQVWPPASSTPLSLPPHRGEATSVAFRRDGTVLATAGEDGVVLVANARTGALQRELRRAAAGGQPAAVTDVDWLPDGRLLAVDAAGVLALWDGDTGTLLREISAHPRAALAVAPLEDGSRVVTGGADGAMVAWDVASGTELWRVPGSTPVVDVSATPDGRRVLIMNVGGTATAVDAGNGHPLGTVTGPGARPLAAQLDPAAPDRAAVATSTGAAAIWAVPAGHGKPPSALAMASDGTALTVATDDGTMRFWSPEGRERGAATSVPLGLADAALSADGRHAVLADTAGVAHLWAVDGIGPAQPLPGAGVTRVAISPDGRLAATAAGPSITIWNTADGTPMRTVVATDAVRALAFSPTADRMLSAAADRTGAVWRLADGQAGPPLRLDGVPNTVAWDPSGALVATSGTGLTVQLWDPATGQPRARWTGGHRQQVNAVAFDATGARLASVGDDGEVNVWRVADGTVLVRRPHQGWVYRVAFTPDGTHLLITDSRGVPRVEYLDAAELLRTAQSRTTRGLFPSECARYVQPYAECEPGR